MRAARVIALWASIVVCFPTTGTAAETEAPGTPEDVVLLHGLGRTPRSMAPLADALSEAGYRVHNVGYPSTDLEPDELIAHVGARIDECCASSKRVHFVTHSLGGILLRAWLAENRPTGLGRVVMLAPPNKGSELVDEFGSWGLFGAALGPTATELGTDDASLPNRLPPADYELGVIAGVENVNPVGERMIPGTDDGTVSVESTRIEGMKDHVEVAASHSFIMRSDEVAELVLRFLRTGSFSDPNS